MVDDEAFDVTAADVFEIAGVGVLVQEGFEDLDGADVVLDGLGASIFG